MKWSTPYNKIRMITADYELNCIVILSVSGVHCAAYGSIRGSVTAVSYYSPSGGSGEYFWDRNDSIVLFIHASLMIYGVITWIFMRLICNHEMRIKFDIPN